MVQKWSQAIFSLFNLYIPRRNVKYLLLEQQTITVISFIATSSVKINRGRVRFIVLNTKCDTFCLIISEIDS